MTKNKNDLSEPKADKTDEDLCEENNEFTKVIFLYQKRAKRHRIILINLFPISYFLLTFTKRKRKLSAYVYTSIYKRELDKILSSS